LVLCLPQTVQAVLVQCLALLLPLAVVVVVEIMALVQMAVLVVAHHLMALIQPQAVLAILHLLHPLKAIMVERVMETAQAAAVAVQVLSEAMVQDLLLLAQVAQEPHQALRVFL
jgi:hypothetical protein